MYSVYCDVNSDGAGKDLFFITTDTIDQKEFYLWKL